MSAFDECLLVLFRHYGESSASYNELVVETSD